MRHTSRHNHHIARTNIYLHTTSPFLAVFGLRAPEHEARRALYDSYTAFNIVFTRTTYRVRTVTFMRIQMKMRRPDGAPFSALLPAVVFAEGLGGIGSVGFWEGVAV